MSLSFKMLQLSKESIADECDIIISFSGVWEAKSIQWEVFPEVAVLIKPFVFIVLEISPTHLYIYDSQEVSSQSGPQREARRRKMNTR